MPETTTATTPREITGDDAMELLGITTRQGVSYLIRAGKLPGAHKANPNRQTSVWLIPVASIEAYVAEKALAEQKRAQAAKA